MSFKVRPSVYVVVDTNVISQGSGLNERAIAALSDLSRSRAVSVVFPAPVVLEATRHVAEGYKRAMQAVKAIRSSHRTLGVASDLLDKLAATQDPDWARALRATLGSIGTIAPMPTVSHEELVQRDLAREHPFKDNGAGYRDALIWETVRDLAETGRRIALVTANHRDFGAGSLPAAMQRDLPVGCHVSVLKALTEVEPWLAGAPVFDGEYRSVHAPVPFPTIAGAMEDAYVGLVSSVRFGRRLNLDAEVEYMDEWTDLWDVTEYDDLDDNTALFDVALVGNAYVTATAPRELLGLVDDDVAIEIEAGSEEAALACRRPIRVAALIQVRLDTNEVTDVDVKSANYHSEDRLT
jgi:hypothetical protein